GKVAGAVGLRVLYVFFAREDLQVPEAEEDDRERGQHEGAEDRDAKAELRGSRDARLRGAHALEGAHARDSGLRPPVVYARRRRRRGSSGRPPCSARRTSVQTAGATIELTTTPSTIWRSSCRLTGASTPSMNSTIV